MADADLAQITVRPVSMPTSASAAQLDIAPSTGSARPPVHAQLISWNTMIAV